jgi:branched-chain amino acid transport system permease protein
MSLVETIRAALLRLPGGWPLRALLAGLVLALLPFAIDQGIGRAWLRILDFALINVLLALGLNVVIGFAGLLDLGYIAFLAVGAYVYALFASPHFNLHLTWALLLPAGAFVAAVLGSLLGAPTLKLRGDYLAIVTLGFGEIIRIFLNNLNHPVNLTNGPQGITLIDPITIAGASLARPMTMGGITLAPVHAWYFLLLACVLLAIVVCTRLQQSRIGRAWAAIREDEVAARAMGINTRNLKLLAFATGASFGGLAGGLFSAFQGFVSPESFTLQGSVMILCMVVLGGMGHVAGVVLGALALTALPEALRLVGPLQQSLVGRIWIDPADLRMVLFGLALIAVMRWRPEGLWPSPARGARHGKS